jgi:hypothetical protein
MATKMKDGKRRRMEKTGWFFGSVKEFLQLTGEEEACIELRLQLTEARRFGLRATSTTELAHTRGPK